MNQGTRQRIVGTVVLLALALIFLPIIFDGQGSYQTPLSSRIPDPPVITLLPEPTPERAPIAIASPSTTPAADAVDAIDPDATDATSSRAATDTAPEAVTPEPVVASGGAAVVSSEPVFSRDVPALDANGLPQGWSVRLGSFSDASNASALLQRLQSAGYRAYTRRMTSGQTELTGVFVGPWLERERVAEFQKELQDEFQLSGMVVRYQVEQLQD